MSYEKYLKAEHTINEGLIRVGISKERERTGPKDPNARMVEMRNFLEALDNPQRGIPAVHVAGTSGKGSVSAHVAGLLTETGLKVGLHISPYLQSATEKIWIQGQFASADEFASLIDWVEPEARRRLHPDTPASIHGMASVAIAYEAFRRAEVDVMVYEAGCGARFDLTSFVDTKVAVITNVGLDHVLSLGPEIEQIAWHKAGVARPSVPLISGATESAGAVVRDEAARIGALLEEIPPGANPMDHNRAIAIRAAQRMMQYFGKTLDKSAIEMGLERVRLAGRSEVIEDGKRVIVLDGAHNGPKISVAISAAAERFRGGPRIAVVGFLGAKASPQLLQPFAGRFDQVVVTEPRVYAKTPMAAPESAEMFRQIGFDPIVEPDADRALERAVELTEDGGNLLVTGSFYLIGELRDRWYPKKDVVLGRSSWPSRAEINR